MSKGRSKRLYRFYCLDCDNAWSDVLMESDKVTSECSYCQREFPAEKD